MQVIDFNSPADNRLSLRYMADVIAAEKRKKVTMRFAMLSKKAWDRYELCWRETYNGVFGFDNGVVKLEGLMVVVGEGNQYNLQLM